MRGSSDWFTGNVWLDEISEPPKPSRLRVHRVTFAPGSRTAWHSHPVGQILHVTTGIGLVQIKDAPVKEMRPGDTVWIEPNERHWHGAAPNHMFVHIAIQEAVDDGTEATWFEHVTDVEYDTLQMEPRHAS
jgi:quercetin dioxygenase-like cupin family protein